MIELLIVVAVVIGVCYAAFWIIDNAFPEPIRVIAKIVVGIIALVYLAGRLGVGGL